MINFNNKKKMIVFVVTKLFSSLLGLIINIVIVRKLSVEKFGIYSLIMTLLGFLINFGFNWTSSAIIYFGAQEKSENGNLQKIFWARNFLMTLAMIIISILYIILYKKINIYIGIELKGLFLFWIFIKVILDILTTYFLAVKKQIYSALVLFIGKIPMIIALFLMNFSVRQLIIINILCDISGFLFIFKVDFNDIKRPKFDKESFKLVLEFGAWQLIGFSGIYIINFGDNIVINHYMTLGDLGMYNIAYKLFNPIANLSTIISSYYAPVVVGLIEKKKKKNLENIFYNDRLKFIAIIAILHIIVFFFGGPIIETIYGKNNYKLAIIPFKILIIGSLSKHVTTFNRIICNSLKKNKILQFWNILQMILNIGLDFFLVKRIGILGAALGTTLAILITNLFSTIYSEKILKNYLKNLEY